MRLLEGILFSIDNASENVDITRVVVEEDCRHTRVGVIEAMIAEESHFFAGFLDRLKRI